MGVAREGLPFIAGSAGLTLLAAWWPALPALTILLAGLTLFVVAFFRDPDRQPAGGGIIAPADGKVVYIGPGTYPGGPADMTMISIFMSVFNVHVNRVPLDGTVLRVEHTPGAFVNAARADAPAVNERTLTVLATAQGEVAFCQVAGLIARRIVCRLRPGDAAVRGARMGLIRFGSRVDVYVPRSWLVRVAVGEYTRAGATVVAEAQS
ncbi:MAG TPA: phosphatidylserine decarboxylase [bacterium]|nr:phosphatidylserine decarboxylase [bacterium]